MAITIAAWVSGSFNLYFYYDLQWYYLLGHCLYQSDSEADIWTLSDGKTVCAEVHVPQFPVQLSEEFLELHWI